MQILLQLLHIILSDVVESLFLCDGMNAEVVDRKSTSITVKVTGKLKATYGVWTENISEKVSDL